MADIITNAIPPYASDGAATPAPMKQRWHDNGDGSYARVVSVVSSPATAAGPEIISNQHPPYLSDGGSPPEPVNQRWTDQGDSYALQLIIENV